MCHGTLMTCPSRLEFVKVCCSILGSSVEFERIKPDSVSMYLFKTEHIEVLCDVSSENKIDKISWSLYRRFPPLDVEQKNETNVEIINKWNSSKYHSS